MELKVLNFKPPFYYKNCCEFIKLLVLAARVSCIVLPFIFLHFFSTSKKNHEHEDHISLVAVIGQHIDIYRKFFQHKTSTRKSV